MHVRAWISEDMKEGIRANHIAHRVILFPHEDGSGIRYLWVFGDGQSVASYELGNDLCSIKVGSVRFLIILE